MLTGCCTLLWNLLSYITEKMTSEEDMSLESLDLPHALYHFCILFSVGFEPGLWWNGTWILYQLHPLWIHDIDLRWIPTLAWLQQTPSGLDFLTPSAKTKYIALSLLIPKGKGRLPVSISLVLSVPNWGKSIASGACCKCLWGVLCLWGAVAKWALTGNSRAHDHAPQDQGHGN